MRERPETTRPGFVHKFTLSGFECYIRTGQFPDGRVAEVFLVASKAGSTIRGLLNTIAIITSIALQNGVRPSEIAHSMKGIKFEPNDPTKATSFSDYIFRWLEETYPDSLYELESDVITT